MTRPSALARVCLPLLLLAAAANARIHKLDIRVGLPDGAVIVVIARLIRDSGRRATREKCVREFTEPLQQILAIVARDKILAKRKAKDMHYALYAHIPVIRNRERRVISAISCARR